MKIRDIKMADGQTIPEIGLGLWQVKDEEVFKTAFTTAIKAGYTMFDSAQAYGNEQMLGQSIKESGVKRGDLFLTTKISVSNFGAKKTTSSFHESLKKLETDYIDLMLLHFPVSILRKNSWQALEQLKGEGHVRSIGVSNYTIRHLEDMKNYAKEMPVVNQVEMHVFLQQPELVKYCQDAGIVIEAYSPLAHAESMDNKVILDLAQKHGKSYAQIMLRFLIELGLVVIPKSVTPKRIEENIDIFDFSLSEEDMASMRKLDSNLRTCWNPTRVP